MTKEKIKEMIVVEGKNDTLRLRQFFDCDTIETTGKAMNPETLERIAQAQQTRGVIVFTDPDQPGELIRRWVNEHVPSCKQAFIEKKKARTQTKVGVEHADREDLWEALSNCVTFTTDQPTLSWEEFIDLGLMGDAKKREEVCRRFHIGFCNAKTCFKRLNQMQITKEEILQ